MDLRERAVEAVESGASRREIAEIFKVGVSSVIRWCHRWSETGSAAPKPSGGSVSPLEEHSDWILALIAKQPDLTLEEILAAMAKQGIPGSRSALQRFFDRHNVSFKKSLHAAEQKRADVARARPGRAAALELAPRDPCRPRRLSMAARASALTISRAAEILGEDEELLWLRRRRPTRPSSSLPPGWNGCETCS
jgi:transposase